MRRTRLITRNQILGKLWVFGWMLCCHTKKKRGWMEKLKDTKGVIRNRKSKDRHHNGQSNKVQRDKQWTTKHHRENEKLSNTNPTKYRGWNQVFRKNLNIWSWNGSLTTTSQKLLHFTNTQFNVTITISVCCLTSWWVSDVFFISTEILPVTGGL